MITHGADRFINALLGRAVAAPTAIRGRLHTADPPTTGNQLSGNGYAAVSLTGTSGTLSTPTTGKRRLSFPNMQFFADAGANAQTSEAFGLWHDANLAYAAAFTLTPNNAALNVNGGHIQSPLSGTWTIPQAILDAALRAVMGSSLSAKTMRWALHSGSALPANGNLLTGGGLAALAPTAWTFSSQGDYRRAAQGALSFSTGLSADTNAEPTRLALWQNDPYTHASPVLHMYASLSDLGMTESGASITTAANQVYYEVILAGVAT